jgi:uncharacterized OB-fold protein
MSGVTFWRCTQCATPVFPERLLCPRCHSHTFMTEQAHEGVVEEISIIRHMIGQTDWKPRRIANVRTPNGPWLTVGLRDDSGPGTTVELWQEENAPFGKARA